MIFGNTLTEKVTLEQIAKQIGLAASADAGNHLHLTIPHKGDDFLQIAISFYFHSATSIENLLILSYYFSIDIMLQRKRKINGLAEKFANKPDNISMKQSKRRSSPSACSLLICNFPHHDLTRPVSDAVRLSLPRLQIADLQGLCYDLFGCVLFYQPKKECLRLCLSLRKMAVHRPGGQQVVIQPGNAPSDRLAAAVHKSQWGALVLAVSKHPAGTSPLDLCKCRPTAQIAISYIVILPLAILPGGAIY